MNQDIRIYVNRSPEEGGYYAEVWDAAQRKLLYLTDVHLTRQEAEKAARDWPRKQFDFAAW